MTKRTPLRRTSPARRLLRSRRRHARYLRVLAVAALFVAMGTAFVLRVSGITLTRTETVLDCQYDGHGAHTHDDRCYNASGVLVCPLEERPLHVHTPECYATERVLACGLEEYDGHQHGDECFDEWGELICAIPEGEGAHHHTDECYQDVTTDELICGLEEITEEHVHTDACFKTVTIEEPDPEHESGDDPADYEEPQPGDDPASPSEPEPGDDPAEPTTPAYPEQDFSERFLDADENEILRVDVEAPEGAFPEGTTMVAESLSQESVQRPVERVVTAKDETREIWYIQGVRITFYDRDGKRVQPIAGHEITVTVTSPWVDTAEDAEVKPCVVRLQDDLHKEITTEEEDAARLAEVLERLDDEQLAEREINVDRNQIVFDAQHFSSDDYAESYLVAYTVERAEEPAEDEGEPEDEGDYPEDQTDDPEADDPSDPDDTADPEDEGDDPSDPEAEDPADSEDEAEEPEIGAEPSHPAQTFTRSFTDRGSNLVLRVEVDAPEGAFPVDTTMKATWLESSEVESAVVDAVIESSGGSAPEVAAVQAVDITFYDAQGLEVEPLVPVTVTLTPGEDAIPEEAAEQLVVHVDDAGAAQVVSQLTSEELVEREIVTSDDQLVFDAESFSVYAIAYTVDFHYEINGESYDLSIDGGDTLSLRELLQVLNVVSADELEGFLSNVANVEFSDPSLMAVARLEESMTAGELKAALGLEPEYSSWLTEEDIAALDAKELTAPDWALVSLLPFDTEETLTVTMNNGDAFTIAVTDFHEITSSSAGSIDVNKSYIIAVRTSDNKYQVLKTDGTAVEMAADTNLDKLDSSYRWMFNYVFEEKDREGTLTYTYYMARPVGNKGNTIALNEPNDPLGLVQPSNNNVAIVPQDGGGFKFIGYNDVELHYENGSFFGKANDGSVIHVYEMETLPKYDYTVVSADETMGTVAVQGVTPTTIDGKTVYSAESTESASTTGKHNASQITATRVYHTNQGQQKWQFDYWDMNGTRLQGVGATINTGTLDIPYNGSVLTAHFKLNPNYTFPDNEKEGSPIESMAAWLAELKDRNVPLNEEGTKKTAEVYDYENRIYRVDLTAQSSLATFDGTIDLGFMLDVSASMKFPSYLYASSDSSGAKRISDINGGSNNWRNWQSWGLNRYKTYYIITDPSGTATVCYLFYDNNQWWLCDASKDRNDNKARYRPDTGWSADGSTNYADSYYSTTASYVVMEAGDRVTAADFADQATANLLNKLGLHVGDPKNRAFYLEKSLNGTLAELDQILSVLSLASDSTKDPDVKIAWNTFKNYLPNGNGQIQHNFVSASNGISLNYDYNTYGGGTSTDAALLDAAGVNRNDIRNRYSDDDRKNWDTNNNVNHTYTQNPSSGFQWENSTTKYAVLITDGAPQRSGHSITRRYVTEAAQQLKNQGVNLITVGLGIDNVPSGKTLLFDIADTISDERMFYSAKTGDELEDVLLQILRAIMVDATVQGDVIDTIDEAFYPVDKATGRRLTPNEMIDLQGNVTTNSSVPHGTITYDNATGLYGVTWTNQDFTWDGWQGTVYVKAKEDLLGGNAVKTNNGEATVEAKAYKTRDNGPSIQLKDKKYLEDGVTEDPHYVRFASFETPRVNVNELSFTGNETEWTVYLGTEVDPKEQLKKLWEDIRVEEVVTAASDQDGNSLPEYITGQSHYYPLTESIDDGREEAGTGTKVTFSMNSLIRTLAEADGNNYSWWDYTNHVPNWDTFLTQALTDDGIVIPYDAYSLTDNDNSTITIKLTKDILAGEEADLANSPHYTTVVNGTAQGEGGTTVDVPVEKYNLEVLFGPDYDVVPVGQGGHGHLDFHTGTYGTMYQGHAAGTETSTNDHVINVFAKKLKLVKVDQVQTPITSSEATFALYRKATDAELEDESVTKVTVPGVTGSCVLVQELTTSGGEVTTDQLKLLHNNEPYYLVETQAPDGFNLLPDVLSVRIDMDGHNTWTKLSDGSTSQTKPDPYALSNWLQEAIIKVTAADGTPTQWAVREGNVEYGHVNDTTDASVVYKIINDAGVALPEAGGSGVQAVYLLGFALVACGCIGLAARRRRAVA